MPVLFFIFLLFPIWEANRKKWTFSKGFKMIIQKKKGYKTESWPADTKGSSLKLWVWRNALKAAFVLGSLRARDCHWNTRAQSPAPAGKQMTMSSHLSTSSFSNPTGFFIFFSPLYLLGNCCRTPLLSDACKAFFQVTFLFGSAQMDGGGWQGPLEAPGPSPASRFHQRTSMLSVMKTLHQP